MSLFTIPASVAILLEKIMRDFLWSKREGHNGFHWVCWDEICRPMEDGGLGIRPIRSMNKALKTKWLWRFASENDVLWKRVIVSKYGTDRLGWWSKKSPFAHGVGCWKSIHSTLDFFKSFVRFEVGNGARVLFW